MIKKQIKSIIFKTESEKAQKAEKLSEIDAKWLRLDNAAKIYPVIMKRSYVSTFRISAELVEKIDPAILQEALDQVIDRFPYYRVRLRRGMFWYYFEKNTARLLIEPDVNNPCRGFNRKENKGYLFRIRYYEKRVAVEVFHAVTDATGASIFLKTLIARYLLLKKGVIIPFHEGVLDPDQKPDPEEYEDSYNKYANFKVVRRPPQDNSYKIDGTFEPPNYVNIITAAVPMEALKTLAKRYNVSITEYLTSLFIYAIYLHQQSQKSRHSEKPIQVSVPVNMRSHYPSKTMRNFSLFVSPGIEPAYGEYTLEEIIDHVHHYMRYYLSSKYMNALMCANVGSEKSPFVKFIPLGLKNIAMLIGYRKFGILKFSATLSNLGVFRVPEKMKSEVERFDLMIGPCRYNPINIGVLGYKDELRMTVTSTISETDIVSVFFRHLVKSGIHVKIETNKE